VQPAPDPEVVDGDGDITDQNDADEEYQLEMLQ